MVNNFKDIFKIKNTLLNIILKIDITSYNWHCKLPVIILYILYDISLINNAVQIVYTLNVKFLIPNMMRTSIFFSTNLRIYNKAK